MEDEEDPEPDDPRFSARGGFLGDLEDSEVRSCMLEVLRTSRVLREDLVLEMAKALAVQLSLGTHGNQCHSGSNQWT